MGSVGISFTMSLDGFIALPNDDVGPLFDWYNVMDEAREVPMGDGTMTVSADGADVIEQAAQVSGALVTGRKLFDITHGWGGRHPIDVPIVVLSHREPPEWASGNPVYTFVSGGVEEAIARAKQIAGEKNVAIASSTVAQQALRAGLVDTIAIDLAPVLLCEGIRLFDHIGAEHIRLEQTDVRPARGVTHITYRIVR